MFVVAILFAFTLAATPAEPAPADLVVRPACAGAGFSGTIEREGVLLRFECCKSGDDGHAKITLADGSPFILATVTADATSIAIGGLTTEEIQKLSSEERRGLELLLTGREADLALEISDILEGMGFDRHSGPMITLYVALMAFNS